MEEGKCSSVAVLMSTYNGELYLREQLDSIFRQKYVNVTIYVRDDGSADNTIDILSDYEKCYPGKYMWIGALTLVGNVHLWNLCERRLNCHVNMIIMPFPTKMIYGFRKN